MRGLAFWLANGIFGIGAPAAAETLTLSNCSDGTPSMSAFDEQDSTCWTPRSQATLPRCGTVAFDCSGKCKLIDAWSRGEFCQGALVPVSGAQTYTDGGHIIDTPQMRSESLDEGTWHHLCACERSEMQW